MRLQPELDLAVCLSLQERAWECKGGALVWAVSGAPEALLPP